MEKSIIAFNLRVYGICINEQEELLVTKETRYDDFFTKFPGGGLELGESLIEGLKREFMEELGLKITEVEHFYTTDFFQASAFSYNEQLISVYFKVKGVKKEDVKEGVSAFDSNKDMRVNFHWIPLKELKKDLFTYPIDQHVGKLLLESM